MLHSRFPKFNVILAAILVSLIVYAFDRQIKYDALHEPTYFLNGSWLGYEVAPSIGNSEPVRLFLRFSHPQKVYFEVNYHPTSSRPSQWQNLKYYFVDEEHLVLENQRTRVEAQFYREGEDLWFKPDFLDQYVKLYPVQEWHKAITLLICLATSIFALIGWKLRLFSSSIGRIAFFGTLVILVYALFVVTRSGVRASIDIFIYELYR